MARSQRPSVNKNTRGPGKPGHASDRLTEERRRAKFWLPYDQARYRETGNPVFVWEAYLTTRAARLPSPRFVLEYFDRVSFRFAQMSRQATPRPYRGRERRSGPTIIRTANIGPERRRDAIRNLGGPWDSSNFTRPGKRGITNAVYHALEFTPAGRRGPENPFRMITETSHDVAIATSVLFARRQGHKLDFAFDSVAREHPSCCDLDPPCASISRSTVARLWKRYGEKLSGT